MIAIRNNTKAFTLVELLIVLAILFIVALLSLVTIRTVYRHSALKTATQEVRGSLTEARTRTIAGTDDSVFGVHLSTSSVTRFTGATYSSTTSSNATYIFEGGVRATGTLVSMGGDIIFSRLTGETSASGTVYLVDSTIDATTSVTIYASGFVE